MPIFDQGYQHWQGELAGHGWRWLAITRQGVRVGMQNKFLRLILLGALIPALLLAGVMALWGMVEQKSSWAMNLLRGIGPLRELVNDPTSFRLTAWTLCFHFFLQMEMFIIMVVVLLVGPSLVSQDLRYNALPLYFSRPIRRIDYFLGKLGVIGFFLGLVAVVPAIAAWVLGLMFSLDFRAIVDTFRLLMGLVLSGFIITLSAGLFILAMSSLSRNSRYVAVFWASMWFLTSAVSGILYGIHQDSMRRQSYSNMDQIYQKHHEIQNLMSQRFNDPIFDPQPFPDNQEKPDMRKAREMEERKFREEENQRREKRIAQLQSEMKQLREELQKRQENVEVELRSDWRPLISYTANLMRISYALIGSQEAWERVDDLTGMRQKNQNNRGNDPFTELRGQSLATLMVPQYPWYWSALVLLALGGISLWILNKRVTSLDRLR